MRNSRFNKKMLVTTHLVIGILLFSGITVVSSVTEDPLTNLDYRILYEIRTDRATDQWQSQFSIVYLGQGSNEIIFEGNIWDFYAEGIDSPNADSSTSQWTCYPSKECIRTCVNNPCDPPFTQGPGYECPVDPDPGPGPEEPEEPFTSNGWNPICWLATFYYMPNCHLGNSGEGVICAGGFSGGSGNKLQPSGGGTMDSICSEGL